VAGPSRFRLVPHNSTVRTMHATVVRRIVENLFEPRVMQNNIRSIYVEYMVAELLGESWRLTSGDWSGWDLEGPGGIRLEVKQSAACQTWAAPSGRRSKASFDIKPRNGYWEGGSRWVSQRGRHANVYLFCWHSVEDAATCDQRDPEQWKFYVVASTALPPQASISVGPLSKLAKAITATELRTHLHALAATRAESRAEQP
jgi:hypothetical protein